MYKRLFTILIVSSLLFFTVACGGGESTSQEEDKPDNYIEDIDMNQAIQKARNQMMMLVGHFENPDLTPEEKVSYAQETLDNIMPELQTISYNSKIDSNDLNTYAGNVYGSLRNMSDDMVEYYQTNDETYKTEFYEQKDRVVEFAQKAEDAL